MARRDDANGTGTLGKAMDVLDAVAAAPSPPRFTDLLGKVDQPRGTLHRQVSNLVEEGLLSVRGDHSYELGVRLLRLASKAWSDNQFRLVAEPHLRRLHDLTGETVHLGVLSGAEVVYLDKVESRQAVRMHSQIGNASPTYCTGVGKAALSVLPDATVAALAAAIPFQRFTEHTLASPESLLAELSDIRREGCAFDREEHEQGIRCVAAPIWTADHSLVGGVSITGPAYRLTMERLAEWAGPVRAAAESIMEGMRIRLGPRR